MQIMRMIHEKHAEELKNHADDLHEPSAWFLKTTSFNFFYIFTLQNKLFQAQNHLKTLKNRLFLFKKAPKR